MIGGIIFLATPLTFISGLIALQGFALISSLAIVSVACISLGIPLAAFTIVALAIAAGKVLNSTESPVIEDGSQQDVSIECSCPDYLNAIAPTLEELTGT